MSIIGRINALEKNLRGTASKVVALNLFRSIQNKQLSRELALPYISEERKEVIFSSGLSMVHGTTFAKGKIFATTRTVPCSLIKIDPDTLAYSAITFPADGDHNYGEQIVYVPEKDRLYVVHGGPSNTKIVVSEINPDTLAKRDVIYVALGSGITTKAPTAASDGTYLYLTYGATATIAKYRLSDFTLVGTLTSGLDGATYGSYHAMVIEGTNMYLANSGFTESGGRIGFIQRVDLVTFTVSQTQLSSVNVAFSDDIVIVGEYLYLGVEAFSGEADAGQVWVVKKSDLTQIIKLDTGKKDHIWGLCYDLENKMVYALGSGLSQTTRFTASQVTGTAQLIRIDPVTLEMEITTLPAEEVYPNELLSDGKRLFIFYFASPAKLIRTRLPKADKLKCILPEEHSADIEITNSTKGVILRSPDGTRYRVTVANGGTLSINAA